LSLFPEYIDDKIEASLFDLQNGYLKIEDISPTKLKQIENKVK
jgi:hypothetical protein